MKNSKINIDMLAQEEQKLLFKAKSNSEILEKIINEVERIDFLKLLGVFKESKIKQYDYVVVIINEVLRKSEGLDFEFRNFQNDIYVFNRCYWSILSDDELKIFLAKAGLRTGIKPTKTMYHKFIEDLVKQFHSDTKFVRNNKSGKNLINLRNGTLEINKNRVELRPFRKEDFLTYQLNFDYDPQAKATLFQKFLDQVLPDKTLQYNISEYLGSIFIGTKDIKFEQALFLYGGGSNGKSVIYEVIQALLGTENFSSYPVQKLTTCANTRSMIKDKLLNFSSEVGEIGSHDIFKKLVSRERVDAKILYKDVYEISGYAKLMFNCNDLPKKNEYTHGYFRRFLIIPFDKTIAKKDQDKSLSQKIIDNELTGVLNWILEGMLRLYQNKEFTYSESSKKAVEEFELESDSVRMFLQDENYKESDVSTSLKDIFLAFKEYSFTNGYKLCSKITLSRRLKGMGYQMERKTAGVHFFIKKK
jgi:putative DNA primase/helicase